MKSERSHEMKDEDPVQRCKKRRKKVKGGERTWYVWDKVVKMVLVFEI